MLRPLLISLSFLLLFAETYAQTLDQLYNKVNELQNKGEFIAAIPYAEEALKLAEKEYGKNTIIMVFSLTIWRYYMQTWANTTKPCPGSEFIMIKKMDF